MDSDVEAGTYQNADLQVGGHPALPIVPQLLLPLKISVSTLQIRVKCIICFCESQTLIWTSWKGYLMWYIMQLKHTLVKDWVVIEMVLFFTGHKMNPCVETTYCIMHRSDQIFFVHGTEQLFDWTVMMQPFSMQSITVPLKAISHHFYGSLFNVSLALMKNSGVFLVFF